MKKNWEIIIGLISIATLTILIGKIPSGQILAANTFNLSSSRSSIIKEKHASEINSTIIRNLDKVSSPSETLIPSSSETSFVQTIIDLVRTPSLRTSEKKTSFSDLSQLLATHPLPARPIPTHISAGSSLRSIGALRVSLILYTFKDDTRTPPFTLQQVRSTFFDKNTSSGLTFSEFLSQATYGRLTLTGKNSSDGSRDLYGWYQVNQSQTSVCTSRNYVAAAQEALGKAIQQGLTLKDNDLVVVGTYPDGCPTGGSSMILTSLGGTTIPRIRLISMNNMTDWGNILHEIGHLAGTSSSAITRHSNTLECKNPQGMTTLFGQSILDTCQSKEYGSPLSIMGGYVSGAPKQRLFDAMNRIENGDISSSQYRYVGGSGIYTLTKINDLDATILRIPITLGAPSFNGNPIGSTVQDYLDLTARDFESFEQSSDTAPHHALLSLAHDNELLDIASGNNKKILAPQQIASLPLLGITLENLGSLASNPRDVRVRITLSRPAAQRILPGDSLVASQTPSIVNLDASGNFSQPTLHLVFKDRDDGHDLFFPDGITRIYPSTQQEPALPIDGILMTWVQNLISSQNMFLHYSGHTIDFQPLRDLHIPSDTLQGHPRFIYRIGTFPVTIQNYPSLPTYLIYGSFSSTELQSMGIPSDICRIDRFGCTSIQTASTPSLNSLGQQQSK